MNFVEYFIAFSLLYGCAAVFFIYWIRAGIEISALLKESNRELIERRKRLEKPDEQTPT